jgi:transposase InsO family protein
MSCTGGKPSQCDGEAAKRVQLCAGSNRPERPKSQEECTKIGENRPKPSYHFHKLKSLVNDSRDRISKGIYAAVSSGRYFTMLLDKAAMIRNYPVAARTDNGPDSTGWAFLEWAQGRGIRNRLIEPSSQMQNGHFESFKKLLRDE